MNIDIVLDIYNEYIEKRKQHYALLSSNEKRIDDIDKFLVNAYAEDENLKIFSPYSSSDIFEGRIVIEQKEKDKLLEDNNNLLSLISELDDQIDRLKSFIDSCNSDVNTNNVDKFEDNSNSSLNNVSNNYYNDSYNDNASANDNISNNSSNYSHSDVIIDDIKSIKESLVFIKSILFFDTNRCKIELDRCTDILDSIIDRL